MIGMKSNTLHNNYWLWGPRGYTGEIMIIIGGKEHKQVFREVKQVEVIRHKYAMPYETNLPVYLCRDIMLPLEKVWLGVKHYE